MAEATLSDQVRVEFHRIEKTVDEINDLLQRAGRKTEDKSKRLDYHERISYSIEFLKKRLAVADPLLLSPANLETLHSSLEQIKNHLSMFVDGNSYNQLRQSALSLNTLISSINMFIASPINESISEVIKHSVDYQQQQRELLRSLELEAEGVKTKLAEKEAHFHYMTPQ